LWVLYVVRYRSLRRADHSSRGVLPSVVCLSVIAKPRKKRGGPGPLGAVAPLEKDTWIWVVYGAEVHGDLLHETSVFNIHCNTAACTVNSNLYLCNLNCGFMIVILWVWICSDASGI
jgi:hypothetical protein